MTDRAAFVVLTQGERPAELYRALESIKRQRDVAAETVVISNGAGEIDVPDGVRLFVSRENIGIPGGRNLGAADTASPVIFFLDDDAWFATDDVAASVLAQFGRDPALGIVSLRLADPVTGRSERRHVPRLRVGDAGRASDVTTFLGGACAVRRTVFERCGAYPKQFFYSHEESDLAWRALDAGFRIHYLATSVVLHPARMPSRHPGYHFMSSRNRVWLARRRLPWPLGWVHVAVWTVRSLVGAGSREGRRQAWRGIRAGWSQPAGDRAPISWQTAWRMSRLGRPPIV